MDAVIETFGLTKHFRGRPAIDRLDLKVPRGSIFALLGDNGAGKTTTIRLLTGQLQADAGHATILGEDCWNEAAALRPRVGYVPERPRFYDWMTVEEIGWFTGGFYPAGFFPRYRQRVHDFKLDLHANLQVLSKGQYAKVALALALAPDPEVLILEEPTSGLDLFVRREFLASMVRLSGEDRTILISGHQIAEIERVASHVAFLADGKLLMSGTSGPAGADFGYSSGAEWKAPAPTFEAMVPGIGRRFTAGGSTRRTAKRLQPP
jgi:ABC-2 type transport system ATP-binding protein